MEKVNTLTNNNVNNSLNNSSTLNPGPSSQKGFQSNEKQLIGIFKVNKLAKHKFLTNERLLVVSESTFSYYNLPPKKGPTELFVKTLDKIYNPKKISSSNLKLEEEEKDFALLTREFLDNFNYFQRKEEMPYDLCESLYDPDEKDNSKDWKFCVIIRQKNSDGKKTKEPNIYSIINKAADDKSSGDKAKENQWVFNLFEANFLERYKKLLEEIRKKKLGSNLREINHPKPAELPKNPPKPVKKEEDTHKKDEKAKTKEENIPENDPEVVQMMYYNEICFQYLMKQYYMVCSLGGVNKNSQQHTNQNTYGGGPNTSYNMREMREVLNVHLPHSTLQMQKMKYEFAILQLNTKFKEICQTLAKRIVADLYAKPFQQSNPSSYYLFPIVFPYPTKLKKQEQAVFLYYIGGINFTLTWHQTLFKMRSEQKFEVEEVQLNGAWNNLNVEFKNRDFFQDLMVRLSKEFPSRLDLPRFPISCIVDYCGFRLLCEADVYVDDGGAAIMRRSDGMNTGNNNNNNNPMNDPNWHFYKEVANIISNDKAGSNMPNINSSANNMNSNYGNYNLNNGNFISGSSLSPNIKPDKDLINTVAEILIPVSYQNRDLRQQYAKQLYNFQHVIRYHSKQFKEVDSVVFSNSEIESILRENDSYHDNKEKFIDKENYFNFNNANITGYDGNETSFMYNQSYIMNKETFGSGTNQPGAVFDSNTNTEFRIAKEKLNEFFDISGSQNVNLHLKDFKESVKYIMDLKVLIEIKDKFLENNTGNNIGLAGKNKNYLQGSDLFSSLPKRSIYFRPEFIVKYLKESGIFKTTSTDRESDINEIFLKNLKKYLFLDENSQPHYKNILEAYKHFKENHINYFINCLDTLHFKPYDSESLTETFHGYGVNMFYLGLVAELTSVPHVRELCLLEMISRICKKMIYDMVAQKVIRRANEDYYTGANDHGKNVVDYDYTNNSSEPYLQYVPATFFVRYWKDYLKKLHILGSDSFKCTYYEENNKGTTTYAKGLYRRFWHRCTSYADKDIKPIFATKEENKGGKVNKENNENLMLSEAKKEIVQFLNVLFDFDSSKSRKHSYNKEYIPPTCRILNIEYSNKTLWDTIFERVKSHYNIDNKEVFAYCDPLYISLPALLSSIQHQTGITVNFSVVNNTKYSNKELINKEFTEDMIEIKPKTKTYSYRYFTVNREKFETVRNDYSLDCDTSMYRRVLLRYFTEKFQKNVSHYTSGYLHYMNSLRRMDGSQDSVVDWICKNDVELKEKIKTELDYYDFFKAQFTHTSLRFESFNYLFLQIIESFANIYRDDSNFMQNTTNGNGSSKNIAVSIIPTDFNSCVDYISEFWFSKHPFLAILNILIARLNLKTTKHFDEKTEVYFKSALSIAKDSLGSNNIFVANLCEEIGYCYIKSRNFYDGTKHYIMSYNVFREHKDEFYECYMKILKKITKYFIILGYYKDALDFGSELVNNFFINSKRAQTIDNFNIDVILYNLILIARILNEYERAADFCRKLLYDLQGGKPDPKFAINKFRDWRSLLSKDKKKIKNSSMVNKDLINPTQQEEKFITKNLFQIFKLYMKIIVRNLKDTERAIYIQALVKLIENKNERDILKKMSTENDILFDNFFNSIKDEGELSKYFSKMLYTIGAKFEQDKGYQKINESTSSEIDRSFNEMWVKFRTLYKIFQKHKVFTSFIDSDVYGGAYK
jgi:hypothetical protein